MKLLFSILILFTAFTVEAATKAVCRDCNIIFIAMDALQANHISHLGYRLPTTPTIDALAKKGVSFKTAISPSSWTVPTYLSLFSSEYPSNHGLTNRYRKYNEKEKILSNFSKDNPSLKTLAEVLKNNGYHTGAFTGDAGISKVLGYDKGFDAFNDDVQFGGMDQSVPKALSWLEKNKNEKFFLFLHGYDVHGQYKIQPGFGDRFAFKKIYKGPFKGTPEEQATLREKSLHGEDLNLTEADKQFWISWYDGKIFDADQRLADFLSSIEKMKLKKTIIILTSDHGTEFFEHGKIDHGHTLFDELIHVPLIFVIPEQKAGFVVKPQVSTMDIMPTLLELTGVPTDSVKHQMKGHSLVGALMGKKMKARSIFSETDLRNFTHLRSVRTADAKKYIIQLENGHDFLFDLKNDPGEKTNLAAKNPKMLKRIRKELMDHLEKDLHSSLSGDIGTDCLPVYKGQCE